MGRVKVKTRDMTVEEYDAWAASVTKVDGVAEAADDRVAQPVWGTGEHRDGGPRLSLVPVPDQNIAWPTDLLPSAASF